MKRIYPCNVVTLSELCLYQLCVSSYETKSFLYDTEVAKEIEFLL